MLFKHVCFVANQLVKSVFITPTIGRSRKSLCNRISLSFGVQLRKFSVSEMSVSVKVADYGTWKSPITSDVVSKGGVSLAGDLEVDEEGRVYWIETRSSEAGRNVICSFKTGGDKVKTDWTPEGFNARTRASEYGGGSFFVSKDGAVYFSNFKDQRLYRQKTPNSLPEPVTEDKNKNYMYADGQYISPLKKIVAVREDHSGVESKARIESENTIVAIDPETKEEHVLVSGADFYNSPRVSQDGKKLVWVEWNHPNMPWDSTEIWYAKINDDGTSIIKDSKTKVAGGNDNSVILPKWSPEGELYYIDDRNNWWNLHHFNLESKEIQNIVPKESEIGGPQWIFGIRGYAFGPKGSNEIYGYFDEELSVYNTKTSELKKISTSSLKTTQACEMSPTDTIACSNNGQLFLISGNPCQASALYRLDPKSGEAETIVSTITEKIDEGYLSIPEKVSFPTSFNGTSYGYLYLPKNKDYIAPEGQLPPLMVRAHGGPTASARLVLSLKHQYLTSRGIAVLDVNYRGSTGFGRKYRDSLKKNWGILDIDDVTNGALFLVKSGKVDGNRLSIDGGSAGGYTTIAALTFKSVFHAGISFYGISDLEALAVDTHKFESRYLDSLVGAYPEEKQVYIDRSPIHHTEKLSSAIAFFQGGDDKVVPPSQAEKMFEVLKKKGLKTAYILFPEEQHGFRNAKNIKRTIDGELYFLAKVFGFEAPDIEVEMEILNM